MSPPNVVIARVDCAVSIAIGAGKLCDGRSQRFSPENVVGSVDYDVWLCPKCNQRLVIPYKKWFSKYSECPKCRRLIRPSMPGKGATYKVYPEKLSNRPPKNTERSHRAGGRQQGARKTPHHSSESHGFTSAEELKPIQSCSHIQSCNHSHHVITIIM